MEGPGPGNRSTADRAALTLRDHDPVAAAEETAATAHRTAVGAESAYDEAGQAHDRATAAACSAARQALAEVTRWAPEHPALRGLHDKVTLAGGELTVWDTDDVEAPIHAESAAFRDQLDTWADPAPQAHPRPKCRQPGSIPATAPPSNRRRG